MSGINNENKIDIDENYISRGYTQYKPTPYDSEFVETRFQKRFDDDKGKKYFIDIIKHKGFVHPYTKEEYPPSYEYETQMYQKGTHNPVNFEFLSTWTIEEVEEFMEKQFATGMFDHYEMWDGKRSDDTTE